MLTIKIPPLYMNEHRYIIDVIFGEFLGLAVDVEVEDREDVLITAGDERQLYLCDVFFAMPQARWLREASLPALPLAEFDVHTLPFPVKTVHEKVPIIYGQQMDNSRYVKYTEDQIELGVDILGSSFFMLTRYEECVKKAQDAYQRFPATASLSYTAGFIDRPIVNEYVEILWGCLCYLWPGLVRRRRRFRIQPTHDVDDPFFYRNMNLYRLARHLAGKAWREGKYTELWSIFRRWLHVQRGDLSYDPFNTFELIMDISELMGVESTFFFMTDHLDEKFDGDYRITDPAVRTYLGKIKRRGHKVGLHCSYSSYLSPDQVKKEYALLRQVCAQEGITQELWGSRQHFLRWETPTTFRILADVGVDYDTTLTFADHAGFRCGVCYEYPVYDLAAGQPLKLRERPLIVMECTVIDGHYMGLGAGDAALEYITMLKDRCKLFEGEFVLLWHNTRLIDPAELWLYKSIMTNSL